VAFLVPVTNPYTGEVTYELDYSDGLPYDGAPFDVNTGAEFRDTQPYDPSLLPPGVVANDPWKDGEWNTGPQSRPDDSTPPPTPTPSPAPSPTVTTGAPTDLASLLSPFPRTFTPPDPAAAVREATGLLPELPDFDLPGIPEIDPWELPSKEAVFQDPSFELRRGIGERSLLNNRAAQGLARTGGTLKDLLEYNQGFASSEYGNIANRSLSGWQANTDATLRRSGMDQDRAKALYEPRFAEYMNKVGVATRAPRDAFDQAMEMFRTDWDLWKDSRDSAFSKLSGQTGLGLSASS
jgi:hypothetical protein